jgi:hypothetical protein
MGGDGDMTTETPVAPTTDAPVAAPTAAPAAPTDEGADDSKAYGSSGLFTLFFIMVAIAVAEGV